MHGVVSVKELQEALSSIIAVLQNAKRGTRRFG